MSASRTTLAVCFLPSESRYITVSDTSCACRGMHHLAAAPHLDGEADDLKTHLGHVRRRVLAHKARKVLAVLVDFLDRQRAENGAQVALQRLQNRVVDLLRILAQERLQRLRAPVRCRRAAPRARP